jgi:hypothetical protein
MVDFVRAVADSSGAVMPSKLLKTAHLRYTLIANQSFFNGFSMEIKTTFSRFQHASEARK